MKKFLLSVFSILTLLTGVVFASCGDNNTQTSMTLSSDAFVDAENHYIEIDLTNEATASVTVKATIEGQENGRVKVVNNYGNLTCETSYNQSLNTNTITITALEESDSVAELIVRAESGNVEEQKILVSTYSNVTSISQKTDDDSSKKTQYVVLDEMVTLSADNYLDIVARETCNRKDVTWGYVDGNTYGGALVINGNRLRLDSNLLSQYEDGMGERVDKIVIRAQSKYQEAVGTNVTLDVIRGIDGVKSFEYGYSVDNRQSVYDNEQIKSLELVRTNKADEKSTLYYMISFASERSVSWVTLTDEVLFEKFGVPMGTLDITKYSEKFDEATKTYTYIFKVENENSTSPADYSFNFSFTYSDYDYVFETDYVKVALIDIVERIEIKSLNNEVFADGSTVDVYNVYADGKGQFFDVTLLPTSAKDTNYFVRLKVAKTFVQEKEAGGEVFDTNKYLKVFTEANSLITFAKETEDDNYVYFISTKDEGDVRLFGNTTKLYALAQENAVSGNAASAFEMSFVSSVKSAVKSSVALKFIYAPTDDFEITDEINHLDYKIESGSLTTQTITVNCPALAGIDLKSLYAQYITSDNYTISALRKAGTAISFDVTINKKNINDKIEILLCHKNGYKATAPIKIEFFKALTSASVSLLNANSNNIAYFDTKEQNYGGGNDNSLNSLVATFGSTISIQLDHDANDCVKGVKLYYFIKGENGVALEATVDDIYNGGLAYEKAVTNYFSYNEKLSSLTLLTTKTTYSGFVVVEFIGYDNNYQENKLYRIFAVESYVPISTLATKSTPVETIASDSLSAQDANTLSKKTVEVTFRTDGEKISYYSFDKTENRPYFSLYSATAKNDKTGAYEWDETTKTLKYHGVSIYSITNIESMDGKSLSFVVNSYTTKDFTEFNDIIVLECNAFKSVYRLSIDLTIKNSKRVESVIWENQTDDGSIYLLTRTRDDITENNKATIITTVQEAYNTSLAYKYIAENGQASAISFVQNGKNMDVVSNKGASGGYGYIYVLPQDAVKANERIVFSYYDANAEIVTSNVPMVNLSNSSDLDSTKSWYDFLTEKAFFITNDGRVVGYDKILIKIKLIVADGLSEETAIRIYTADEVLTMTSVNHYVLMNNIEISNNSPLFAGEKEAFTGSLRGYNKDIVITMKENAAPIFGNIGENGVVRDLTFNGEVYKETYAGFVASSNDGTISNITIDVYEKDGMYLPSVAKTSYASGVGGIVGLNNAKGKILSSRVLGVNLEGGTVGGIAGGNSGLIDGCVVEFYKFKKDETTSYANQFKTIGGNDIAGGIVGQVDAGSSVIQNTYAYDYTLSETNATSNIVAGTIGAFVGQHDNSVGKEKSKIVNSFAVVGISKALGKNDCVKEDYYVGYYGLDNGTVKYKVESTMTNPELWITDDNANFDAKVNGGFSYLKFNQNEAVDVAGLKFVDSTENFVRVDDTTAILYLYEVNTTKTLNNAEKNSLSRKNTYSLSALFGIDEELADYIVVSSSDKNIVKAQLGKLETIKTGEATITVLSRQNFSTEKTFKIQVIHVIADYKSSYNGLETSGIEVQEGRSAQIDFTIKEKTYLNGAEEFNLVLDNVIVEADTTDLNPLYATYSVENRVGSINVKSGAKEGLKKDDKTSFVIDNYIQVVGLKDELNEALKGVFTKQITFVPFEGTNYIGADYSSITIYPSISSTFEVTLGTDSKTDDLFVSILQNNTKLQVRDEEGNALPSRVVTVKEGGTYVFSYGDAEGRIKVTIARKDYDEINKEYIYQFIISIYDSYKSSISSSERYTLSISSKNDKDNEFEKNINLVLESQKIENIEITNYTILQVTNDNGLITYTRTDNSVTLMAPGSSSILEVNMDPSYSYYEYLTINYVPQNNELLTFTALNKDGTKFTQNLSSNVSSSAYGLVWAPAEKMATFAFKIYISSTITTDCVFPIVVTFYGYDENNAIVPLESRQILLYVTCISQPQILVNGSEYAMLAKGATADVSVTLDSDQTLESLTFEGTVKGITLSSVSVEDNNDGTKTYNYKLFARVTASVNGSIGQFGLKATVSRVLNGVRETKSMVAYVALVELEVSSVSIVNAVYSESDNIDIVTAYENIERNFEFDYQFNPASYGTDLSTEEFKAIYGENGLNYKKEELKSKGYLADDNYHINYSYDEKLDVWKEILLKDQLFIVNSNGREQKITWTALDENVYSYVHYDGAYAKFRLTFDKSTNKFTIVGNSTTNGLVRMRIKNVNYIESAGKNIYWENTFDFGIQVKSYTSEDAPEAINNAKDFLDIQQEGEAKPYILMNDIVLEDYVPFDTSLISSLDGNGYTIYLNSFDMSAQETSLKLALFTQVSQNTTLKNLRVNIYNGGQIDVDTRSDEGFTNIQIAGLAITNEGIIYNCEVVAFYNEKYNKKLTTDAVGLVVTYKRGSAIINIDGNYAITSRVAGFVIENNGNITNSRVGGTQIKVVNENVVGNAYYTDVDLGLFTIKAQGEVSGFVSANAKNIVSSKASNMQITNEANYNKFETAGFVNTNTGRIKSSYIVGLEDNKTTFAYVSSSIDSKGIVAGFVVNNGNGAEISDSMSNIKISTSSLFGAGFVYKNDGKIIYAFSASQVESSSFTQMGFTGLDAQGNLLSDLGEISFSYYYDMSYTSGSDLESAIDTGASLLTLQDSNNEKLYYGFSFASGDSAEERLENADGIWYFKDNGKISIVSADTVSYSTRYIAGSRKDNSFIYVYSDMVNADAGSAEYGRRFTTEYGSKYNPIIIATADDFDNATGTSKSTNISKYFSSTEVFGSYRFVDDIDFDELDKTAEGGANVSSTSKVLTKNDKGIGLIDGNGFEIKNLSITSSANSSSGGLQSFGLFSKIINGAKVLNLNLNVTNVTAGDVYVVGSLTGLVYNATVVGVHVDQVYSLTPESSPESSENGVKGQNIAGGVIGAVVGVSKVKDVSIEDALVQVNYYDSLRQAGKDSAEYYLKTFNPRNIRTNLLANISNLSAFNQLSIAGGVVGYADTYREEERVLFTYTHVEDVAKVYSMMNVSASSTVNVRGEVVGGILGYTSETTNVENARLVLSVDAENQNLVSKILSYNSYAGGITGLASGYYFRIYTAHDEKTQDNIESGYYDYYNGGAEETSATRGILDLFYTNYTGTISYDYNTQYIGGLVGVFVNGEIENSYSKINVIAKQNSGTTAGGVIGRVADSGTQFTYTLEISNGARVPSSVLLKEVYVTGDVKGGYIRDERTGKYVGYAGGIAGQIDRQASLSLLSVNAVNSFSYANIETDVKEGQTEKTGTLSSIGVYGLVGGQRESRGTINILTSPTYNSDGEKDGTPSTKAVGYFSYIKNSSGETINIERFNGDSENAAVRIEYYSTTDGSGTRGDFFKIKSVAEFKDVEDGFNSVLSAFTVGKHWNPDNWKSQRTNIYPEIRFSSIKTYFFLDANNQQEVLQKMQYSSIVVYVRGLNPETGGYEDVDLTKYGAVNGFSGTIVGPEGWLSAEEKEKGIIARKTFNGDYVGIILNKALFNNVGQNFVSKDLRVEYGDPENDNVGKIEYTSEGALYISGTATGITIDNMVFNLNGKFTINPVAGNAGIICSSLTASSVKNTTINLKTGIKIGGSTSSEINIGLIAGFVRVGQGDKYNDNKIVTITQSNNGQDNEQLDEMALTISNITKNNKDVNVGGLFGQVTYYKESKDDNEIPEREIEISGLDVAELIQIDGDLSSATLNVGGQIGVSKDVRNIKILAVGTTNDNLVQITSNDAINELSYGGIIGNVCGVNAFEIIGFSENNKLAKTKLKYGCKNAISMYAGGAFGKLAGENIKFKSLTNEKLPCDFIIGNSDTSGSVSSGCIGGFVGNASVGSLLIDNVEVNFDCGVYDSQNNLFENTPMKASTHIGGIIGQNVSPLVLNNISVNGRINAETSKDNYVGGLVGYTTGDVSANVKKDTNTTAEGKSIISINIIASASYVGGLISYVDTGANIDINNTLYDGALQVFGDKESYAVGGLVGFVAQDSGTVKINNSAFGGNIFVQGDIVQGDNSSFEGAATHNITKEALTSLTIGGIVGEFYYGATTKSNSSGIVGEFYYGATTKSNSSVITNCVSYGDAIIRYGSNLKSIGTYNFGGIVGIANNTSIKDCVAIMMNNNSRIATPTNHNVYAMVGVQNKSTSFDGANYYSSSVCLCVQDEATDIGYYTDFSASTRLGYNDSAGKGTSAIELIKGENGKLKTIFGNNYFGDYNSKSKIGLKQGTKLRPFVTGNDLDVNSPIVYVVADSLSNKVNLPSPFIKEKIVKAQGEKKKEEQYGYKWSAAFIGDGFTVGNVKSSQDGSAIFKSMVENDVISSVVMNASLNYDVGEGATTNIGSLALEMNGGVIYASGAYGTLSVGCSVADCPVNLGGLVGNVKSGLIVESYSSVDVTYRAGSNGRASGFANIIGGNYASIYNSFSTGKVETYIEVDAYAFSYAEGDNVSVNNCYTISPVKLDDQTKGASAKKTLQVFGGGATYNSCYNDYDAVNDKNNNTNKKELTICASKENEKTSLEGAVAFKSGNFVYDYKKNYGYPTRNFGFLKRDTIVTAYKLSINKSKGTTYYARGNYVKLDVNEAISGAYELKDGKYVVTEDTEKIANKDYYKFVSNSKGDYYIKADSVTGEVYESVQSYLIPNARKLAQIKENLSENYSLEYDIDLSNTKSYSSGDTSTALISGAFSGVFEGNGRTISGLKYCGLFESLNGASVNNLRLTNVEIGNDTSAASVGCAGALAQNTTGNVTLNKIVVNGFIVSNKEEAADIDGTDGGVYIGGLVGLHISGALTINNSQNYIRLVTTEKGTYIGGFVAYSKSGKITIENCVNYGTIEAMKGRGGNRSDGTVGGFIGAVASSSCYYIANSGNANSVICGYVDTESSHYIAGGFIGETWSTAKGDVNNKINVIYASYNTGMVKAGHKRNDSVAYAAGFIGYLEQATDSHIQSCLNEGPIEALGTTADTKTSYVTSGSGTTGNNASKITFTYKRDNGINVYADAFANFVSEVDFVAASKSKNEADVFRNGFYGEKTLEKNVLFSAGDRVSRGFEDGTVHNITDDKLEFTRADSRRKGIGVRYKVGSSSEVTGVYITQQDELGGPISYFITIPRTLYYPGENDGKLVYKIALTRKQEIYTDGSFLDAESYYSQAHKSTKKYEAPDVKTLINNNNGLEKNNELFEQIVINSKSYAVAKTGETLIAACNNNLFTTTPLRIYEDSTLSFVKNGVTTSMTVKDLKRQTYTLKITNVSTDDPKISSPLASISNDLKYDDSKRGYYEVIFKFLAEEEPTENPTFTYTITAVKTDVQILEPLELVANAVTYEKVSDTEWATVIYLENLLKGNQEMLEQAKQEMIDETTYKVTVNYGIVEQKIDMLYSAKTNTLTPYNENTNYVELWSAYKNVTLSWDIVQNKTLEASRTYVGEIKDYDIDVSLNVEKNFTLSQNKEFKDGNTSFTYNGSFENETKDVAFNGSFASTIKDENAYKTDAHEEYVTGTTQTYKDDDSTINITPYYKYQDSEHKTISQGTTILQEHKSSEETDEYGNLIYKDENGEIIDQPYCYYDATVTIESVSLSIKEEGGVLYINNAVGTSYTINGWTYNFALDKVNHTVEISKNEYYFTYSFDLSLTQKEGIKIIKGPTYIGAQEKDIIPTDVIDANVKDMGVNSHLTYAKVKPKFTTSDVKLSGTADSITLTLSGTITDLVITNTTDGELSEKTDWINKGNFVWTDTSLGGTDKYYMTYNPSNVSATKQNISGNSFSVNVTFNYTPQKARIMLYSDVIKGQAKSIKATNNGDLIITEYGDLKGAKVNGEDVNSSSDGTNIKVSYNKTFDNLENAITIQKTYKVVRYSATYSKGAKLNMVQCPNYDKTNSEVITISAGEHKTRNGSSFIADATNVGLYINTGIDYDNLNINKTENSQYSIIGYDAFCEYRATADDFNTTTTMKVTINEKKYEVKVSSDYSKITIGGVEVKIEKKTDENVTTKDSQSNDIISRQIKIVFSVTLGGILYDGQYMANDKAGQNQKGQQSILLSSSDSNSTKVITDEITLDSDSKLENIFTSKSREIAGINYLVKYDTKTKNLYFEEEATNNIKTRIDSDSNNGCKTIYSLMLDKENINEASGEIVSVSIKLVTITANDIDNAYSTLYNIERDANDDDKIEIIREKTDNKLSLGFNFKNVKASDNLAYRMELFNIRLAQEKDEVICETVVDINGIVSSYDLLGGSGKFKANCDYDTIEVTSLNDNDVQLKTSDKYNVDGNYYIDETNSILKIYPNSKKVELKATYYLAEYSRLQSSEAKVEDNNNAKISGIVLMGDASLGNAEMVAEISNLSGNGYNISYYKNDQTMFNTSTGYIKNINIGGVVIVNSLETNQNLSIALFTNTVSSTTLNCVKTYGSLAVTKNEKNLAPKGNYSSFATQIDSSNIVGDFESYVNFASQYDKYVKDQVATFYMFAKEVSTDTIVGVNFVNYGTIIGYDGKDATTTSDAKAGQSINGISTENEIEGVKNNSPIIKNLGIIKAGNGGNGLVGAFGMGTNDSTTSQTVAPASYDDLSKNKQAGDGGTVNVFCDDSRKFSGDSKFGVAGTKGKEAKDGITGLHGVNTKRYSTSLLNGKEQTLYNNNSVDEIKFKYNQSSTQNYFPFYIKQCITARDQKFEYKDNIHVLTFSWNFESNEFCFATHQGECKTSGFAGQMYVNYKLDITIKIYWQWWPPASYSWNTTTSTSGFAYVTEGIVGCAGIKYKSNNTESGGIDGERKDYITEDNYIIKCEGAGAASGDLA